MICKLNFQKFLHTLYKCAKFSCKNYTDTHYFDYYAIILRGPWFPWTQCINIIPKLTEIMYNHTCA